MPATMLQREMAGGSRADPACRVAARAPPALAAAVALALAPREESLARRERARVGTSDGTAAPSAARDDALRAASTPAMRPKRTADRALRRLASANGAKPNAVRGATKARAAGAPSANEEHAARPRGSKPFQPTINARSRRLAAQGVDVDLFHERAEAIRAEYAAQEAADEVRECTFAPVITDKAAHGDEIGSWRAEAVWERTGGWRARAEAKTKALRAEAAAEAVAECTFKPKMIAARPRNAPPRPQGASATIVGATRRVRKEAGGSGASGSRGSGGGYSGGYGGKGATRARAGGATAPSSEGANAPPSTPAAVAVREAAEVTARAQALLDASAQSHGQSLSQQQSDMSAGLSNSGASAAGSCAGSPSLNAHDSEIADSDAEDAHESNVISCGGDTVDLKGGFEFTVGQAEKDSSGLAMMPSPLLIEDGSGLALMGTPVLLGKGPAADTGVVQEACEHVTPGGGFLAASSTRLLDSAARHQERMASARKAHARLLSIFKRCA